MSEGILYVATGEQFVEEAIVSARSAAEAMGDVPITLVSDQQVDDDVFDSTVVVSDPSYSFGDQIRYMDRSPYDRTLFLDTDAYVAADCRELFDLLDEFDVGLAYSQSREAWTLSGVPESFPEYNSGVVLFRDSSAVDEFLEMWERIYREEETRERNQPSLRKALYTSDVRIATLTPEYNCMFRYPGHVVGPVKIFHGRLLDIETPGAGRYHDPYVAMERINATDESRVFTQLGGIRVHTNREDSLIHRARLSAHRHGYRHLLAETVRLIGDILRRGVGRRR